MTPFPVSDWVECKCERCGFTGSRRADSPHVCLVMVNLDQYEKAQKDAARYRYLRDTPPWKSAVGVVMAGTIGDDIVMLTHDGLDATIDAHLPQIGEAK